PFHHARGLHVRLATDPPTLGHDVVPVHPPPIPHRPISLASFPSVLFGDLVVWEGAYIGGLDDADGLVRSCKDNPEIPRAGLGLAICLVRPDEAAAGRLGSVLDEGRDFAGVL